MIRPHGPYLLGGSCFGGVIAFEMAQQLRASGNEVGPLFLFDSFVLNNPHAQGTERFTPLSLSRRLSSRFESAYGMADMTRIAFRLWADRSRYLSRLFKALSRVMHSATKRLTGPLDTLLTGSEHARIPVNERERLLRDGWIKITEGLMRRYVPDVYDGSIVFFKATESDDPEPLWTGLATGGITIHKLPGRHLDMLKEPTVSKTASLVREHLEAFEITSTNSRTCTCGTARDRCEDGEA